MVSQYQGSKSVWKCNFSLTLATCFHVCLAACHQLCWQTCFFQPLFCTSTSTITEEQMRVRKWQHRHGSEPWRGGSWSSSPSSGRLTTNSSGKGSERRNATYNLVTTTKGMFVKSSVMVNLSHPSFFRTRGCVKFSPRLWEQWLDGCN